MLKGLEAVELQLSEVLKNVDFRLDAEFHRRMPADNPQHRYVPIGDILQSAQYGISIDMNEEGDGYPIYRMNEIENMLCSRDIAKYAAISRTEAQPFFLKDGDVLFNRTNSQVFVGRTGLYKPFNDAPRVFASYLIRFIPNQKKVLPEYLTAFLNTSFGVLDVKRRARISINQSNVNAEEVKAVRLPLLNMNFQEEVAALFAASHDAIIQSANFYIQAENLLLDALDLHNWQPPQPLVYEQTLRVAFATRRLDAEHFQPQYVALLDHIEHHASRVRQVDEFAAHCDRGEQPEYVEDGSLAVINSRHILENGLDYDNFERTDAAYWDNPRFITARVQRHDVLTYMTGANVGRTAVCLSDNRALASNEVNILRLHDEHPIYVGVVLNSMIGRMQTRRAVTGSAQVHLYPDNIAGFTVPFVEATTEYNIVTAVEASYAAQRQAKQLLEAAKRAVEIAIEMSEQEALSYLKAVKQNM